MPNIPSRNVSFWMPVIFSIGFAVRVALILFTFRRGPGRLEPFMIALSLANHGTYADAFGPSVGPTAHTMPFLPIVLAIIIRIAGAGSVGRLIASILAAIVGAAAFALLPELATKCQLGKLPGVTAGLIGAIAPVNYWAQTAGVFDAPYTMLGLTALCIVLSGYWIREFFPTRGALSLGVLSGVVCLVNPTILQVLVGWTVFGVLRFKGIE